MKIWMVHDLDHFVVHLMDFHMKQNIVVVNKENNIVVFVKEQGLFWFNNHKNNLEKFDLFSRLVRGTSSLGGIFLVIIIILIVIFFVARRRRHKDVIMVPTEPPMNEQQGPPFYRPPPPPMGYPPPPNGNPYAVPPQNYEGNFNPYPQQHQMAYPPQHQMAYPPQQQQYQMPYPPQQQSYNPYQVKEGGPPAYDDAIRNNQGIPTSKPT